jgi:hypothetical protein
MSQAQPRPLTRRLALGVVALVAALFGSLLVQTPALAVGCTWNGCNGKDPSVQGCGNDAVTLDEFTYGARFEMRYSAACHAVWTRVTSSVHYNTIFGQIRAYQNPSPPAVLVYGVQATEGQHWTKMVSYSYWVKTCRAVWFDADPSECTAYH